VPDKIFLLPDEGVLAVEFIHRGYRGWLSINNGPGRKYADQKPAQIDLHLSSWSSSSASAPRVPHAMVLSCGRTRRTSTGRFVKDIAKEPPAFNQLDQLAGAV
jgi:hypothetical protein